MKNFIKNSIIIASWILCFIISDTVIAQELMINDGTARYKRQDYPAVIIYMEPKPNDVKKAWKDFLQKRYDVRLKGYGFLTNRDVLSAENTDFDEIAPGNIDFYTEVIEDNNLTKMSVFASLGNDVNIGLGNDYRQYYQMKGIVQSFLDTYLRGYYEDQVKEAQDRVSDLEKTQNNKQRTIESNLAEIARLQEENERLANEVTTTQTNSLQAREELALQRQKLDNIIRQLAAANNPVFYNENRRNDNN
ncbi:MAG: coiled-coil domain-containing protein [Saprospiraceae bacterium]